jgi:hypothetical protein
MSNPQNSVNPVQGNKPRDDWFIRTYGIVVDPTKDEGPKFARIFIWTMMNMCGSIHSCPSSIRRCNGNE